MTHARHTRDEIFALRKTMSARQIATMFGMTRNQVVGIWYRERVKRGEKPLCRPRFNHPEKRPKKHATVIKLVKKVASEPIPEPIVPPDTVPVSLIDLRANQCRYPVTDESPHLFCGAPRKAESAYCPFHHRVCWTTQKKGRGWFVLDLRRSA